jgi:hypothetical protein
MRNRAAVTKPHLVFALLVLAVFVWGFIEATGFAAQGRELPLLVSSVGTVLSVLLLVSYVRRMKRTASADAVTSGDVREALLGSRLSGGDAVADSADIMQQVEDEEDEEIPPRRVAIVSAWILGYLVGIYVLGFLLASTIFVIMCLRVEAKAGWIRAVLSGVAVFLFVDTFNYLLGIRTPESVLDLWIF